MIKFTNTKRYINTPFDQYVKFNGYSHSFLKSEKNGVSPEFIITEKIKLGSLVDAILTQDDKIDFSDPQFNRAIKISIEIKNTFGDMIKNFIPQVSYTSTLEYNGLKMNTTGRLDWELLIGTKAIATIDLKVTGAKTDKEFKAFIDHMGYSNQLWNYCGMSGCNKGYIIPYSTTTNKCLSVVNIPIGQRNEFWENKILKFGSV